MLYRKDKEKTLAEQFKNPAPCFRAAPFWAWNGALDERVLRRQTQAFMKWGLEGGSCTSVTGWMTAIWDINS